MKVSEIFNKLVGLNPNTEYDFTVAERGKGQENTQNENTPEPPAPVQPPTSPIPNPLDNNPLYVSRETYQAQEDKLNQALNEINNLKQMNFALLTNTPVGNNEPSVEECIMNICMPNYKKGE